MADVVLANEREVEVLTGRGGAGAAAALGERYRLAAVKMDRRGPSCADGRVLVASAEMIDEIDPRERVMLRRGAARDARARCRTEDALARACHAGALVAASEQAWPQPGLP